MNTTDENSSAANSATISNNDRLINMLRDGMPLRKFVAASLNMNDDEAEQFYEQLDRDKEATQ